MQSKRDLKKQIRFICGDLVGECLIISEVCPLDKRPDVEKLIIDLAILQESTIAKCTFNFDKSMKDFANAHDYNVARTKYFHEAFAKLHAQFNASLADCVHRMNEIAGLAK